MSDGDRDRLIAAVDGQFRVDEELGRGGMGIVYRAVDLKLDRTVAIKVLPDRLGQDPIIRERFLREARTAARLTHPNIVPVFQADDADGLAYFVMGYVDGETLADRVRQAGPLPPATAVPLLVDAARALAYAHARGVIHRDVKPENILVERGTGRAVVTDFGIARAARAGDPATPLTSAEHVMGTAQYMSPEQAAAEPLDGRSDIYALGVVGYFLLSGRVPFDGPTSAVLAAHVTRAPTPLAAVAPGVPGALAATIDRCLAKSPDERPHTGDALADALLVAMAGSTALAIPTGRPAADAPGAPAREGRGGLPSVLSTSDAEAIWRRAAELQSAATGVSPRVDVTSLRPAYDAGVGETTASLGYTLTQVEAAGLEAGIDRAALRLALSELATDRAVGARVDPRSTLQRAVSTILGPSPALGPLARTFDYPAERTLAAVGRVLSESPFGLALVDSVGAHPLAGGVLVYELPAAGVTDSRAWAYGSTRGLRYLRVTVRPTADGRGTHVTIAPDLRHASGAAAGGSAFLGTVLAALGWGATALGAKALALTGIADAATLAVGGLAGLGLGLSTARASWRATDRGVQREVARLLDGVQSLLRTTDVFGGPLPPGVTRRASGGVIVPPVI